MQHSLPDSAKPPLVDVADVTSTNNAATVRFGEARFVFSQPVPEWFDEVLQRVCALGDLRENWDSYGAKPIDPQYAVAALRLLLSVLEPGTPAPLIVPTSRGGLQLEWHQDGVDLEVDVLSPSRFRVSFEDTQGGEEWEEVLSTDLSRLVAARDRLTSIG